MDMYSYEIGILVPVSSTGAAPDVTGFDVEATDGHIGKVDEATYEESASCLVVDTGFWIFGKKRMLPASVVDRIDTADHKVYVNRTKDQIKDAPEYDESLMADSGYRDELGTYYGPGGRGSSGSDESN